MYYVFLKSIKDKKFYTGSTNNLVNRIKRHNKGLVRATKYRRPLKLIYYESSLDIKDAVKREKYLKTAWGKRYIKNRIRHFMRFR